MRLGIAAEYFRDARCQASRESGRLKKSGSEAGQAGKLLAKSRHRRLSGVVGVKHAPFSPADAGNQVGYQQSYGMLRRSGNTIAISSIPAPNTMPPRIAPAKIIDLLQFIPPTACLADSLAHGSKILKCNL